MNSSTRLVIGGAAPKHILLLFTKDSERRQKANPKTLTALFNAQGKKDGLRYEYAYYEDLLHVINRDDAYILDTASGKKLDYYDLVYQRRWGDRPEIAMACAIYLKAKGVPFIDKESDRPGSMDKLTQHWRLWEAGLPFPSTVFVPAHQTDIWVRDELESTFALPCIMKSVRGTRGQDNHLVHSAEAALKILKNSPDVPFIFQEYIPNDGDYRALVAGGKLRILIHRTAVDGTHTNNTSQGGLAQLMPVDTLSSEARAACLKAAQVFGRDLAGVDIVFDRTHPDKFYFFEVNRSPQIEASSFSHEKAEMIHEYLKELLTEHRGEQLLGRVEPIDFPEHGFRAVPARIDTGARTSAIWASQVSERDGELSFTLFGPSSPFYTGEILRTHDYDQTVVSGSTGQSQQRYVVRLPITLAGKKIRATFTLADRSEQVYPVLIGRRVLRGKFIVDVKRGNPLLGAERDRTNRSRSEREDKA